MSYSYLKKYGTKKWQRSLAIAITTGLLAGGYAYDAHAAEYNKGLVGSLDDNKVISNVVSGTDSDLTYNFTGDNTVKVYNTSAFHIKGQKNVIINTGGLLTLGGTTGTANLDSVNGLSVGAGSNVVVNGKLNINSHGKNWSASGITVSGNSKKYNGNLIINGDVSIRDKSQPGEWGLTTENIHGGLGPGGSGNSTAPNYTGARWAPSGLKAGLYGNMELKGNVDLAVKGNAVSTDPQELGKDVSVYDSAVITLNGGNINIETPKSKDETYYAIANYGGTINVNMSKDGVVNDKDVTIKGNILTMKEDSHGSGGAFFYRDGRTNIALTTDKSSWTGVIDNTGSNQAGEVNLYVQNGADWIHESMSKTNGMQVGNMPSPSLEHYGSYDGVSYVNKYAGGSSAEKAGHIFQNDSAKINIKDYSGHTTIVYKHENDGSKASDFKAGDVVIGKAAEGSAITVATDSKNIKLDDFNNISNVLNNLAGKLTYQAYVSGEKNLTGKVQIASGLTSGSFVATPGDVTGNIIFNSSNGKGSLDSDSIAKPVAKEFTTAITGNKDADKEYAANKIIQEDGSYKFTESSTITVKDSKNSAAVYGKDAGTNLAIDAGDKTLTIIREHDGSALEDNKTEVSGIKAEYNKWNDKTGKTVNVNAAKVNINVTNTARSEGITAEGNNSARPMNVNIKGDTNITSKGSGYALGIFANSNGHVKIDGNVSMKAADGGFGIKNDKNAGLSYDKAYFSTVGLYAGGNGAGGKGSITVNGDLDLVVDGTGILANMSGAAVDINGGGTIKVNNKPAKFNGTENDEIHYAIAAASGTVNMNVQKDEHGKVIGAGDKAVNISGNIGVDRTAVNEHEKEKNTEINLGLNTADSVLHGVVVNNFTKSDLEKGYTSSVNLYMGNGATWINEAYGTAISREDDGVGGENITEFKGSKVTNFVGGKDAKSAAYIIQKDKNALNIENYSGNAVVVYEHTGNGTQADHYTAGDTLIKHAAANSGITLMTDSKGIEMTNQNDVASALNTLAGKLTYINYGSDSGVNERNLTGKVQIASGLTSSAVAYRVGNIAFNDKTGQGSLESNKVEIPNPPDHQISAKFESAITGNKDADYEYVAKGVLQKDGSYKFTENSKITVKNDSGKGAVVNDTDNSTLNINAEGKILTIESLENDKQSFGVGAKYGRKGKEINITAEKTNINVTGKNRTEGISANGNSPTGAIKVNVKGDTNITSYGSGYAIGVYANSNGHVKIDGNVSMKAADGGFGIKNDKNAGLSYDKAYFSTVGLYAGGNGAGGKGSITVNGDLDLVVDGTGILANMSGAAVDINGGGTIKVNNKPAKFNGTENDEIHYAIAAASGTVNMNVQKDEHGKVIGAGDKAVNISGNIGVDRTAVNEHEKEKNTEINLGLNTADSVLHGVVVNNFTKSDLEKGYTSSVNLYMGNGATWINEAYGTAVSKEDDGVGGENITEFKGSKVTNFVGGSDVAAKDSSVKKNYAYIIQKDKNDLNIENYKGNSVIVYEHINDGSKVEDYVVDSKDGKVQAGNVVIGKAEANSNVVLSTDSKGINVRDNASVEKTFGALAQKLTYTAADANLKGSLQIASGLTSGALSYKIGDLDFAKDENGVAHYVPGSIKDGAIQQLDTESEIMKGVRSAIASNALTWRDTASDLYNRRLALLNGESDGAWARATGGQTKFNASGIDVKGSYWAGQVGYDKTMSDGWTVGASFDYVDGDADYNMGGQSENTLYGIGLYGSKALKDNAYFDFAVKAGHVKGEFSAKNELSREVKGDYSATSYAVSAQYGKRYGDIENGYFEPQLQLTWARLGSDEFTAHEADGTALDVTQDAFNSFVGRVGIEAGQKTNHGNVYARLSLAHEFAGDADAHFFAASEKANGVQSVSTDLGGTWSELTIGGTYNINKTSNFYADITKTLTGDYENEWKVNAGLKFSF